MSEYKSSEFTKVTENITLGCITPEARELLDVIMEKWEDHYKNLKENYNHEPSFYGFAYWLVRWSNLIQPKTLSNG